jgi:hypothetical protein
VAVNSGVAPHLAFLNTSAGSFPCEHGNVTQHATRKSSTFSVAVPRRFPGAMALAGLQDGTGTSIFVSNVAGAGVLISGEIDTIDTDYIGGIIRVTGRDESGQLNQQKVSQKWQNQTGGNIVQQLVGQAGLGANASAGTLMAGKQVNQDFVKLSDNTPIMSIINRLAEFDGAKWWVSNGIFNYAMIGTVQGVFTVNFEDGMPFSSDATRLQVKQNLQAGKNINVNVKSWNPRNKQAYMGQSNTGGGGSGSLTANYHVPVLDQAHAQQYAKARAAELGRHAVTVTVTVIGDPSINQGMGLQLAGTASAGLYEIDSISHDFGMSGYMMTITAKTMSSGGGGGGGGG